VAVLGVLASGDVGYRSQVLDGYILNGENVHRCNARYAAGAKRETMDTPNDQPRYFDDDGNEMNPDLIPKPALCVSCVKDEDPSEEMLCSLNRLDQQGDADFRCEAYQPKALS
jgi:hypothetical protein